MGFFSQFVCVVALPLVLRWLLTVHEQRLQNGRGAEAAVLSASGALTLDPRWGLAPSQARTDVTK